MTERERFESSFYYLETKKPPEPSWELVPNAEMVISSQMVDFSGGNFLQNVAREMMGRIAKAWQQRGLKVVEREKKEGEMLSPLFAINPVVLGKIPEALIRVLKGGDLEKMREALRRLLPEMYPPLIQTVGKEMEIGGLHPNFCNLIVFEDPNGDFRELEGEPIVEFSRSLMAKLGSWKVILVPVYNRRLLPPILGTMEQGHPRLSDLDELARRLHVFASVNPVGGVEDVSRNEVEISRESWVNSHAIHFLKDFGRFLGERGLISPPVEIGDYVRNPKLSKLITRLVKFTRQQEGAFALFTPEFGIRVRFEGGEKWDGLMVVSRSGSDSGMVLKTQMDEHSAVPVIPWRKDNKGMVARVPIEGIGPYKPSVEAEEFVDPLSLFKPVKVVDRAFGRKDEIYSPPIIGIIHLHRAVKEIPPHLSRRVVHLRPDLENYPPVGCGVDAMQAMSWYYMQQAVKRWERSGGSLEMACAYVPNHGTNFFVFPKKTELGELVLVNPFGVFMDLINSGLELTSYVPQV